MDNDAAYEATMATLCHVYRDRYTILAAVAKEDSARSRWLLVAAALWKTANESKRALDQIEHNSISAQPLRDNIKLSIENSRSTSYAFYCNAGFGQSNAETDSRNLELVPPTLPESWDASWQSVGTNGDDPILDLFTDIENDSSCQRQ